MTVSRRKLLLFASALACLPLAAGAADSTFTASLDGKSCQPEAIETPATGKLSLKLSADGKSIAFKLEIAELENTSQADMHLGSENQNGPAVLKLWPRGGKEVKKGVYSGVLAEGTVTAADLGGPLLGAPLADFIEQLRAGNVYVNVHSNDGVPASAAKCGNYRLGEIRGQVK